MRGTFVCAPHPPTPHPHPKPHPPAPLSFPQVWLSTTGSPHSVIERCEFSNEREVERLEYSGFAPRRRH